LEGAIKTIRKIITGAIAALALASTIAATPASAGGYYRYHSGPDAGAIAGAAVAGMAVGAIVGAAASQPNYYGGGYGYPAYGYGPGYGYAPAYGYGYGW
jgi:hypothetical protein